MATKTTFIWYYDWIDYANAMTDAELWMLFRKILQHVNDEEEITLPLDFRFAWEGIKKKLDEQKEKWNKKVETIKQQNSEKWKKHVWNQYTEWDDKRKSNNKAQKKAVEQMEQNGTNGTNGTMSWYINNTTISSSRKEKENRKEKERDEMLDVFRKDTRLIRFMDEEDVIRWWDFKQSSKKPYKDIKSFITALVKIKNDIALYNWRPKSDRNRRNRFNYVVNEAVEHEREWLKRYDSLEPVYESSKDDLYPNPKQNE